MDPRYAIADKSAIYSPALIFYKRNGDTDSQGGFNVLLGVEHRGGLFFEIKAGAIDSPNFKIGVGYIFR